MEIRITSDLSSEPVSVETIKQYIKFAYDDDTDEITLLSNLNSAVRTHIEKKTGLTFAEKSLEIRFNYEDGEDAHFSQLTYNPTAFKFVLPVAPVISITSVKTVDLDDDETTLTLNDDYHTKGNYFREIFYDLGISQELVVVCTAGYGSSTETLPVDIAEAIKKQVGRWYWHRDDYIEGNFVPEVNNIIQKYAV
jgi:uncharacterized phiE125 gp8 family phage protein